MVRRLLGSFALLAAANGCAFDFDAYQVGEGGAGATEATSTTGTSGGAGSSTGGSTSTATSSSTGGTDTTSTGQGGADPTKLPPCTAPDDFAPFDPTGNVWGVNDVVTAEAQDGDGYASMVALDDDDFAELAYKAPISTEACFVSIRVEQEGDQHLAFIVDCPDGDTENILEITYDPSDEDIRVEYSDDASIDDTDFLDAGSLEAFRVQFRDDVLITEAHIDGAWTKLDEVPRPAWLTECYVGVQTYWDGDVAYHLDDWCVDAPDL